MHIPISTARLSDDGKKIYSVARYYGDLYETDIDSCETKCYHVMEDDVDCIEPFFDIVSWNKKIILTPRNSPNFYVIDSESGRISFYDKISLLPCMKDKTIGFFSFVWGEKAYIMHRGDASILVYDFESGTWGLAYRNRDNRENNYSTCHFYQNQAAMLSTENRMVFLYDANTGNRKEIKLDPMLSGVGRIYINENKIYFYNDKCQRLYECDESCNVDRIYSIPFQKAGQSPLLIDNGICEELYGSKGNEIFSFNRQDEKFVPHTFDSNGETVYYWADYKSGNIFGVGYDDIHGHDLTQCVIVNAVTHASSPVRIKFSSWDIGKHLRRMENNQHNALRKIIMDNSVVIESERLNLEVLMESLDGSINTNTISNHHSIGSMIYNFVQNDENNTK